ncbi:MAG: acetyl-CoA carboxylase carboxyltransferase subunit beta [Capsulimonadales bacterium]|nr:acetyl-CoA carboxylase carboxyltransferase subunit beta [Capsulimonadales bacterium]
MPDWFKRRSNINENKDNEPTVPPPKTPSPSGVIPEGAFTKCQKCGAILYTKDFERDLKVCPKCGHHHRLTADERIAFTLDEGSFLEFGNDFEAVDILDFPEYGAKLDLGRRHASGRNDGLVTGFGSIGGWPCVFGTVDFGFARLAGTMGSVFGEKFDRAADAALEKRLPFVLFCASGGARMQEGLFGLMQMAKTSAALSLLAQEAIPYVVILTDPTTGGAIASYASLGDVIYAEPGATVAFAGDRVASQAQTHKPPANYKTAEFYLEHGMIDRIVPRKEIPVTLTRTLSFFGLRERTTD